MNLLKDPPAPDIAFHIFNLLKVAVSLPGTGPHRDRRLCSALLENSSVMNPLLGFCLTHSTQDSMTDMGASRPMSDLQWMAVIGVQIFAVLCGPWRGNVQLAVDRSWDRGRCVFWGSVLGRILGLWLAAVAFLSQRAGCR